ncbi:ABC transporter permease [Agromyces subbeticus]|uniref:ABC transporter permease n=1 Tax=Agromyces subbeticus TaxID=293890 RepID=UPI0003B4A01C|nr:ABC transporter permease [Agromyces subbeticus]
MKYYARRIAFYAVTLWAALTLNFFIPRMMPGDPADILLAKLERVGRDIPPGVEHSIRLLLGSDTGESLWTQYVTYLQRIFSGDLGVSVTQYPVSVSTLISESLPWTIGLVGLATLISFIIGIAGGIWIGWKRGTWLDGVIPASTLLQSVPYFWLALLLVYFFSVQNSWFPRIHAYGLEFTGGPEWSWAFAGSVIYYGFLPALTIVLSSFGGWLLGMRNMMVSTLSDDYVTTAEAKGLKNSRVLLTYAARNAILPSIAGFGISLGFVVAGSIVMEQVFSYPGIGKLLIQAVQNNDYALMQGIFLIITVTVLAANFIMDLVYGFIDPRTRHNG